MADEKSPSHDDVMKDTVDASEAPEETAMDEANVDLDSPDPEDSEQDASADDGDSASLETQVEELREALLRSQADLQNVRRRAERDVENAHKYAVEKFVKDLSGGERNRLHLAKLLKQGANVLLLDEPTNDLDIETLRALEEALLAFPGSALVISHDRWFLDRIATHILAYEDDGGVVFHEGNYTDYEEDRRQRVGADAAVPSRVKHRKLK